MRKFTHKVLFVLKRVNKVLTDLGAAASWAIRKITMQFILKCPNGKRIDMSTDILKQLTGESNSKRS